MARSKWTFLFDLFQVQVHRNCIIAIGPRELKLFRTNPEFMSDFNFLNEMLFRSSCNRSSGSCECDFCKFEAKYQVQFQDDCFDLHSGEEDKYLLSTVKIGSELTPELIPFSVKKYSDCFSLLEQEDIQEIISASNMQLVALPIIWNLKGQNDHSNPPRLSDIVNKSMENDAAQCCVDSIRSISRAHLDSFVHAFCFKLISALTGLPSENLSFFDDLQDTRSMESSRMIVVQIFLAALAIRFCGTTSLSHNACILLEIAVILSLLGFLFCSYTFLLSARKRSVAATRIITIIGYITSAFGFIALAGMLMPDNIMLEITGFAWVASSLPAIVYAFMKSTYYNRDPILPISRSSS